MLRKIEGKKRREQQRMRWLNSISNTMHNGHESEQTLGDSEGQETWPAIFHGVSKSQTQLND